MEAMQQARYRQRQDAPGQESPNCRVQYLDRHEWVDTPRNVRKQRFSHASLHDTLRSSAWVVSVAARDMSCCLRPDSQAVFEEWPGNCHRWLWGTRPNTGSEQIGDESGIA